MSDNNSAQRVQQAGFTMVELLVSITIIGLLTVSMIAAFTNYFAIITRNSRFVELTVESQNLLRSTVEELRYGAGVSQTNTIADANGPGGGWNTSVANFVIIISMPVIDANNEYVIDPSTGDPYNNEFVYYKSGTTLYKRTLANSAATGNRLKTSCPAAAATSTCLADRKLSENVKTMTFTFYDQDNAITTSTAAARSVKIDLGLERDTFGTALSFDNSIRVTLRNSF